MITTNNIQKKALNPRPQRQKLDAVILLDKPIGMSSNAALQQVKNIFNAKKAGHTGSLDPLASGMLPICFGEATKFSQLLLDADKRYLVTAKLGVKTTTGDAEGEIISQKDVPDFSSATLEKALANFQGEIQQIPSMYSAIKHNGQPLYKLARQGITVERNPRIINIYEIILLGYQNQYLTLEVSCSKGTYIRTLIEDIGDVLECGAHVSYLRRLSVADCKEEQMVSMDALINAEKQQQLAQFLLPIETTVTRFPAIVLSESMVFYLKQGQAVFLNNMPLDSMVRLYNQQNKFLGIGEILPEGKIAPKRLLSL